MGELAVLGAELAELIIKAGFEVREIKQGKYAVIYYFDDLEEVYEIIDKYLEE